MPYVELLNARKSPMVNRIIVPAKIQRDRARKNGGRKEKKARKRNTENHVFSSLTRIIAASPALKKKEKEIPENRETLHVRLTGFAAIRFESLRRPLAMPAESRGTFSRFGCNERTYVRPEPLSPARYKRPRHEIT